MYGVVLHAHPVRSESHNQRNTTGEVATILTFLLLCRWLVSYCLLPSRGLPDLAEIVQPYRSFVTHRWPCQYVRNNHGLMIRCLPNTTYCDVFCHPPAGWGRQNWSCCVISSSRRNGLRPLWRNKGAIWKSTGIVIVALNHKRGTGFGAHFCQPSLIRWPWLFHLGFVSGFVPQRGA